MYSDIEVNVDYYYYNYIYWSFRFLNFPQKSNQLLHDPSTRNPKYLQQDFLNVFRKDSKK